MSSKNNKKTGIIKPLAAAFLEAGPTEERFYEITPPPKQEKAPVRQVETIKPPTGELTREETRELLKEQLVTKVSDPEGGKSAAKPSVAKAAAKAKQDAAKRPEAARPAGSKPANVKTDGKKSEQALKSVPAKDVAAQSAKNKKQESARTDRPKQDAKGQSAKSAGTGGSKPAAQGAGNGISKQSAKSAASVGESAEDRAQLFIEYGSRSYDEREIIERVVAIWVKKLKRGRSNLQSVQIYIKPQEQMVYYVLNQTRSGSFPL